MAKTSFGIFSNPIKGVIKNVPSLLLNEAVTPDSDKVVLTDGEIHRRPMRSYYLTKNDAAVVTPDGNPVMNLVPYIKESTNTLYLLVLTKKHIYHWNTTASALDEKYELAADADTWDYCIFNDKVVLTPNSDLPLVWGGTGSVTPLDTPYGVRVSYSTEVTTVDAESAASQKVLNVAATTGLEAGDVIIIDKGNANEEVGKVNTVQAGVSVTLVDNLSITHAATEKIYICTCITKAKFAKEYYSRLVLGYPYLDQDARWYAQGLYISALNDEDFVSGSEVGYFGIGQRGKIKGFGYYNSILYIFKDRGKVQFFPVAGTEYFNYNEIPDSFGLLAMHSVVNDDKGNLYYLASDYTIKQEGVGTISAPIQTEILDKIQPDYLEKVRGAYVRDYKEMMWALPVESNENNYVIVYKDGVWLLMKDVNISCFCDYYV
ncbi:MAG: hypothetical protein GXY51_02535 [Bacteroidetes bacterium]|nr:hypothetical protein [Bacteroidota bacterium]